MEISVPDDMYGHLKVISDFTGDLGMKFLVEHGRKMEPLHDMIDMGKKGDCYSNSVTRCMEYGLEYCEGYAMSVIPLQHGWCIDEEGLVRDPTWEDGNDYWGVVIPWLTLVRVMNKTGVYGVLCNLYRLDREEAEEVLREIAEYQTEYWNNVVEAVA